MRPSFPMVMPTSTRRGYLWALCLITCLTPASAWCDDRYYPPVPEEDYGIWVPEKKPCNFPTRIVVGERAITLHVGGKEHVFSEPDVALSYFSGSSGDSIAHAIFLDRNDRVPAFYLHFFPGENRSAAVYEVLRPALLPSGFPVSESWFYRCSSVR